jgi:anti-anti-sigma regulatory factor
MLRIDIQHGNESTSFTVAGKLMGAWVEELEKCWRTATATATCKSILVNLASVTFVDPTGRELLAKMRKQGVVLVPTGCLMKAIVEEIEVEVGDEAHSQ